MVTPGNITFNCVPGKKGKKNEIIGYKDQSFFNPNTRNCQLFTINKSRQSNLSFGCPAGV